MRTVFVVLMLLAAPVLAGDAANPEISDPGDDATGARPGMDVAKGWIEVLDADTDPKLAFMVELGGDPQHTPALFALHDRIRFAFTTATMPSGVAQYYVEARPSCTSTNVVVTNVPTCLEETVSCRMGLAAEVDGFQDLTEEQAIASLFPDASTMGCVVPFANLKGVAPGSVLSDVYILHDLITRGPLSGGDDVPPTALHNYDRAPDTGSVSYTIPGGAVPEPAGPVIEWINVTDEAFATNITFTEAQDRVRIHNWTAPAGTYFVNHTADAGANLTIASPDGEVLDCSCNGSFAVNATGGAWNITVAMADFTGTVRVTIEAAPEGTEETPTSTDGPTMSATNSQTGTMGQNETATDGPDEPEGEDSPGLSLLAVLALLGLLGRRGRRHTTD